MKRSNAFGAMATILMLAAYVSSSAQAAGILVDAGLYVNGGGASSALGIGTAYQGGLCGAPCNGSLNSFYSSSGYLASQYAGLPAALPKQQVPLRTAQAPYGPSGWVNGGANGYAGNGMNNNMYNGFPGNGGFNGFPNGYNNFPANGAYNGYANNGFPNGYNQSNNFQGNPFMNNLATQSPCGNCSSAYNNRYAMPQQYLAQQQQVPGAPCGACGSGGVTAGGINGISAGGGSVIINARTPASYEMNDAGLIALGTGITVMNMNSSVFPVGFPREQQTIPEVPTWLENRQTGFYPRADIHSSVFQ